MNYEFSILYSIDVLLCDAVVVDNLNHHYQCWMS